MTPVRVRGIPTTRLRVRSPLPGRETMRILPSLLMASAPGAPVRSPSDVNVVLFLLIGAVAIVAVVLLALAIAFNLFGL